MVANRSFDVIIEYILGIYQLFPIDYLDIQITTYYDSKTSFLEKLFIVKSLLHF